VANPEDDDWQRARQEAVAALQSVLRWNLRPARWAQVREVLAEMTAAVAAPGPAALWDATETLELYAPVRVETRLGDEPREPVPGSVRERVAELVDTLQPHGAGGQGAAGFPGSPGQAARHGA
jgi:hypothetical protein